MKNIFLGFIFCLGILLIMHSVTVAQWTQTNNGISGGSTMAFAISGTDIFVGNLGGGVFLSTDNGTSWTEVNNGLTDTGILSLVVSGTNIFAGTYSGVFLSTNNGTSWTQVNNGLTNLAVNTLIVSGTNIFAGTWGGVCITTDNGTNWTQINNGLGYRSVYTFAISGSSIFAGANGVYTTTDNGTNWTQINNGLTGTSVMALTVSSTNIFAGSWGDGVFLSTDNGTSWTEVNNGLTDTYIGSFGVLSTNIFVGTRNSGVWRRPLSEMITSAEPISGMPSDFSLEQNYPNPFNPGTKIKYSIPTPPSSSPLLKGRNEVGFVSLKVYDVLGNEIATLVNEYKPAGTYEVEFNSSIGSRQLANGVYFYRLQAGDYIQTKKMVLIK